MSARGRIASSSNIGSWISFELFSIQSGDKNTLAGRTSDLFYDHSGCSRWRGGQQGPPAAHLLHALRQRALSINLEVQDKAGASLLRVGPEGRLSHVLNHSTYTDTSCAASLRLTLQRTRTFPHEA